MRWTLDSAGRCRWPDDGLRTSPVAWAVQKNGWQVQSIDLPTCSTARSPRYSRSPALLIRNSTKAAQGRPETIGVAVPDMSDRTLQDAPKCVRGTVPRPRVRAVVTARVRAASARVSLYGP